jgi:death on curing protein
MDPIYLSVEQVLELHKEAIDSFGGIDGLRDTGLLESAVFLPQQSAFGEDAYPTLASKAGACAYFLALNHAFLDGNKRTGAAAMLTFLAVNGHRLARTDKEIEDTIVAVAEKQLSKEQFFGWVEAAMEKDTD